MLAFRPDVVAADSRPLTLELVAAVAGEVMERRHFLVAPTLALRAVVCDEEPFWELFHGQALDKSRTRIRQQFRSWWLTLVDADEPLLALRWDREAGVVHVTRAILSRVHEAFDAGGGVIETRPGTAWIRELVGSVRTADCATAGRLRDELSGLLQQAVVGISRLPLTSIESPLPQFSLGLLAYGFDSGNRSASWIDRFADRALTEFERAKRLEALLRSEADIDKLAASLLCVGEREHWLRTLHAIFNGVSLTPYTEFVPRALDLVERLTGDEAARRAEFYSRLILLLARHLAAYDLVQFHHGGANYPDALLLDELWSRFRRLAHDHPGVPAAPLHRQALRHALLLRMKYAGRIVPVHPTSAGDDVRVLPPLVETRRAEQLGIRLFDEPLTDDPGIWQLFDDLNDSRELQSLGMALFLDRPFGRGKAIGEPDRTPLLAHRLFSRSVADAHLGLLEKHIEQRVVDGWRTALAGLDVPGIPLTVSPEPARPGSVSLSDAARVADDWIHLSTARSSLQSLEACFDWSPLDCLPSRDWQLITPNRDGGLTAYTAEFAACAQISWNLSNGTICRAGIESPRDGLQATDLRYPNKSVAIRSRLAD